MSARHGARGALRQTLFATIDEDDRRDLIVDLSQISFLGEGVLGTLVAVTRRMRSTGHHLSVIASTANVVQKLEMTGLDRILRMHATRPAAIAAAN